MTSRDRLIEFLERALDAARSKKELSEVGRLLAKASGVAGLPGNLYELAREARAKGYSMEADMLNMAIDVAMSADLQGEVYEHSLLCLHELSCDRLDEFEDVSPAEPKQGETPPPPHTSRFN